MALQGHALRLSRNPEAFERLTGVPVAKFSHLLKDIEPLWEAAERRRLSRREGHDHGRLQILSWQAARQESL